MLCLESAFIYSLFVGNIFVFFTFKGKDTIDKSTRLLVTWTLGAVAIVGIGVLFILPKPVKEEEEDEVPVKNEGPLEALRGAWQLFLTRNMLMLTITFFYSGKLDILLLGTSS